MASFEMSDMAAFSVVGTVQNQTWIQGKNGGKQTLEMHILSVQYSANGTEYQQIIPIRFPFNAEDALRHLPPGTRVCIVGTISGKAFQRNDGQVNIYTSFTARAYNILPPASQQQPQQQLGGQPQQGYYQHQAAQSMQPPQPVQASSVGQSREIVVKDEDVPF